ncbi:hypothetical protein FIM69_07570 [Helicobacter pylori]|nr:hypothetical protein FIM69_07570 [Helicobacter pylori]
MKGISLIKIKFKGYAFDFNEKMIPQDAMKIKKGLKNNKLKNKLKTIFLSSAFVSSIFFKLRLH